MTKDPVRARVRGPGRGQRGSVSVRSGGCVNIGGHVVVVVRLLAAVATLGF